LATFTNPTIYDVNENSTPIQNYHTYRRVT